MPCGLVERQNAVDTPAAAGAGSTSKRAREQRHHEREPLSSSCADIKVNR
ncbi:MAG: hypothetical protein U5P41_08200 [Gammaproteobacteria bacterium]|nr:hypothetical protein [Gammaproteobacteria bacterium]